MEKAQICLSVHLKVQTACRTSCDRTSVSLQKCFHVKTMIVKETKANLGMPTKVIMNIHEGYNVTQHYTLHEYSCQPSSRILTVYFPVSCIITGSSCSFFIVCVCPAEDSKQLCGSVHNVCAEAIEGPVNKIKGALLAAYARNQI